MAEFSPVRIGGAPHSRQLHEGLSKTPIRRGRLYLEAGADCIFPIGVGDEAALPALVDGIPSPINVIAGFRRAPGQARLRELGVRRISYAGRLHRAMLADHQRRVTAIRAGEEI